MSTFISDRYISNPKVKTGWQNIWCANHDLYSPLRVDAVTQQLIPYRYRFGDRSGQPVVRELYHHLAKDEFGELQHNYCSCPPGPHAQLASLLDGYRTVYAVGGKEYSMLRFALEACDRNNLTKESIDYWYVREDVPRELLLYGSRGSGKSEDFNLVVLKRGMPDPRTPRDKRLGVPDTRPARLKCYLEHPQGSALILRKNISDLDQFYERCMEFFRENGLRVAGNSTDPSGMYIRLATGYKFVFSHLNDPKAYEKHLGIEYDLIWIEEGGMIPEETIFLKIRQSNRSRHHEIRPMIVTTTNPGLVGCGWLDGRYAITQEDQDGNPFYPAGTPVPITVNFNVPDDIEAAEAANTMQDESTEVREYKLALLSTVDDNPYKLKEGYHKALEELKRTNTVLYRQWRWGDWKVRQGSFFVEFRHNGPRKYCDLSPCGCGKCEPKSANHVLQPGSSQVEPWWPLLLGLDIGYGHYGACLKARIRPEGVLQINGEMVRRGHLVKDWGRDIAKWILEDLEKYGGAAVIGVSQEMWGRKGDEYTLVQQLGMGIDEILGSHAAYVQGQMASFGDGYLTASDMTAQMEEESGRGLGPRVVSADDDSIWDLLATKTHKPKVVIVKPKHERRSGLMWIRELMRWWPSSSKSKIDDRYAMQLYKTGNMAAYTAYMAEVQSNAEVLPKLLLESCPQTVQAIMDLVTDPDDSEVTLKTTKKSDDVSDALRYLCVMYRRYKEIVPLQKWFETQFDNAKLRGHEIRPESYDKWYDTWRGQQGVLNEPFSYDPINGEILM